MEGDGSPGRAICLPSIAKYGNFSSSYTVLSGPGAHEAAEVFIQYI